MVPQTLSKLTTLALCAVSLLACTEGLDGEQDTPRGALLFDLSETELVQIHAAYLPDEDLELTRARLTAPFDCSLYDQFCDQVGPDAAYAITGEIVDMALDNEPIETIDAHIDARVAESVGLADEVEAQGQETFRDSGSWYTQTIGDYRLKVRNGITTPLIGKRHAWTEAQTERKNWAGSWVNETASQLCVNTGTNSQTMYTHTSSTGTVATLLESFNPASQCESSKATKTEETDHMRNNGDEGSGIQSWFTIRAHGCATAVLNGDNFSRCSAEFARTF